VMMLVFYKVLSTLSSGFLEKIFFAVSP